ncbi:hypothetical protein CALCODRAFT_501216 [Calocera cornea HHB12733]|uniref:Uncharacterized protein n=1 Tax=Calocera cornea HHB12733 TaxID=1353952 RepID=A0A165DRI3_9BASI|nr:hypothetical protein CALCODRAFT_501216 [Calocera cornea HHB12733]
MHLANNEGCQTQDDYDPIISCCKSLRSCTSGQLAKEDSLTASIETWQAKSLVASFPSVQRAHSRFPIWDSNRARRSVFMSWSNSGFWNTCSSNESNIGNLSSSFRRYSTVSSSDRSGSPRRSSSLSLCQTFSCTAARKSSFCDFLSYHGTC